MLFLFFYFFFSLLWKWTKLLSSVRHRLHHPPAVYAWNPILPSSPEAWKTDEGNVHLNTCTDSTLVHSIRCRVNITFTLDVVVIDL